MRSSLEVELSSPDPGCLPSCSVRSQISVSPQFRSRTSTAGTRSTYAPSSPPACSSTIARFQGFQLTSSFRCSCSTRKAMGAYKQVAPSRCTCVAPANPPLYRYIAELHKRKQSDVLRFLLRVRCWEYRQLNVCHRASRPSRPDKARRLGYKVRRGTFSDETRLGRDGIAARRGIGEGRAVREQL